MCLRRWSVLLACSLLAACLAPADNGTDQTGTLQMSVVSGDGQRGVPGGELPDPLVARIEDRRGHRIAGQIVNFRVVSGGGEVFAGVAVSNTQGLVQERWTLGFSGVQRVEARAVDPATGRPLTFAVFNATFADSSPPITSNVIAFPNPAQPFDSVTIRAQVSDTFTGGSNIASAEVQVDSGPFMAMFAVDGAFDQQNELVTRLLPGLSLGTHLVCVRGTDSAGNIGFPDCTVLIVTTGGGGGDSLPPITSNLVVLPNPAHPTDSIIITALVSDSFTGHSNIVAAELEVDTAAFLMMFPQDGAFDEQNEVVTRTLFGMTVGVHQVCVRGRDAAGNMGVFVCTLLTVSPGGGGGGSDTLPPQIVNLTASPNPAHGGDSVIIRAEVRDTFTGGSNIANAEVRVDSGGFAPMFPSDGAFDQENELVARTLFGLSVGAHLICVRGSDTAGNVSAPMCIGLNVTAVATAREKPGRRRGQ